MNATQIECSACGRPIEGPAVHISDEIFDEKCARWVQDPITANLSALDVCELESDLERARH